MREPENPPDGSATAGEGNCLVPAIDEELAGHVRLGIVQASPVAIAPAGDALTGEIQAACTDLERRYRGREPSRIEELRHARNLYRFFGIDPTRHRPSSEALLRRVILGKGFPRISNAVDLCNLLALRFLLSPGLYDRDRLAPPVNLRRGKPGEAYAGIRKDRVNLEDRPVLADARGPFGNPTSDSLRTCVTESTIALWLVLFAPADFPSAVLEDHVREAREAMARHLVPAGGVARTAGTVI